MKRYILRRLLLGLVVIWMVSVFIFIATRIGPDPVLMMASVGASEEDLNALRQRFGLNKPLPVQYLVFVSRALQGDLGESLYYGVPVLEIVRQNLPASLELIFAAQCIALGIGLLGGVLAAAGGGRWFNQPIRIFSIVGLSMPNFFVALLCLLFFSVYLKILPTSGRGGMVHLLMPAFSLGWYFSAGYTRLTHSSLLEVLHQEYIKLARIKGLPEWIVVGKHALRNALIPVVTLAGMNLVLMVSAAVAIETVFRWPGLGFLTYKAAMARDFNVVQGVVIVISGMMVVVNLIVDILYAYLDPRIRYS
jgi:ABC-type dipeptide/oligopeptide/nickel transport system permease component